MSILKNMSQVSRGLSTTFFTIAGLSSFVAAGSFAGSVFFYFNSGQNDRDSKARKAEEYMWQYGWYAAASGFLGIVSISFFGMTKLLQ